ncbi:hypothetical protein HYH03_016446 [Edaphochlamys debaryana]|uniref:Uncharacterized protein n=1 Tax=Edaphochlamys debaryana TaxID=47281 RepID=A0A835XL56_9CHLO|nr:hypothetical protein HYH03_016446 [Edaphochlamys debaryana]|eukprot:KAG2484793.1 hypothetical protein HYH03_016446 [Edaphochlamys debaryana]
MVAVDPLLSPDWAAKNAAYEAARKKEWVLTVNKGQGNATEQQIMKLRRPSVVGGPDANALPSHLRKQLGQEGQSSRASFGAHGVQSRKASTSSMVSMDTTPHAAASIANGAFGQPSDRPSLQPEERMSRRLRASSINLRTSADADGPPSRHVSAAWEAPAHAAVLAACAASGASQSRINVLGPKGDLGSIDGVSVHDNLLADDIYEDTASSEDESGPSGGQLPSRSQPGGAAAAQLSTGGGVQSGSHHGRHSERRDWPSLLSDAGEAAAPGPSRSPSNLSVRHRLSTGAPSPLRTAGGSVSVGGGAGGGKAATRNSAGGGLEGCSGTALNGLLRAGSGRRSHHQLMPSQHHNYSPQTSFTKRGTSFRRQGSNLDAVEESAPAPGFVGPADGPSADGRSDEPHSGAVMQARGSGDFSGRPALAHGMSSPIGRPPPYRASTTSGLDSPGSGHSPTHGHAAGQPGSSVGGGLASGRMGVQRSVSHMPSPLGGRSRTGSIATTAEPQGSYSQLPLAPSPFTRTSRGPTVEQQQYHLQQQQQQLYQQMLQQHQQMQQQQQPQGFLRHSYGQPFLGQEAGSGGMGGYLSHPQPMLPPSGISASVTWNRPSGTASGGVSYIAGSGGPGSPLAAGGSGGGATGGHMDAVAWPSGGLSSYGNGMGMTQMPYAATGLGGQHTSASWLAAGAQGTGR